MSEALSFYGENKRNKETINRLLMALGIGGMAMGFAGMTAAAVVTVMAARHPPQVYFLEVDKSTGWVGETVSAADAPKLFDEQTDATYLRAYIEARRGYSPFSDEYNYKKTQLMSSPEEAARYVLWHNKDPEAPARLGKDVHADVANLHPELRGSGKSKTKIYDVRYQYREIRGPIIGRWEDRIASVEFHYDPQLIMDTQQRQLNQPGMQVTSYQDNPTGMK